MIFSDYIGVLNGGDHIELNPWILNQPEYINLSILLSELSYLRCDYSVTYSDTSRIVRVQIKNSKVELLLDDEEKENHYLLRAISLSE